MLQFPKMSLPELIIRHWNHIPLVECAQLRRMSETRQEHRHQSAFEFHWLTRLESEGLADSSILIQK